MTTGKEFHRGTVPEIKLNLKESEDVEKWLYFFKWIDLVLVIEGIKYSSAGVSIKSWTTLKKRINCVLNLLNSSDSHSRWSTIDNTLLVLLKRLVAYLAALLCIISSSCICGASSEFVSSSIPSWQCACPTIHRGQGSGFLSEGFSWLTACMSEQRRFWQDCADAQARPNLRCSNRR